MSIFIEYKYIFTDDYYLKHLRPLFHSQSDFTKALEVASQEELHNYLWCPVHVALQTLLISLCLFIGFNAMNHYIKWFDTIRATLQAIIIFSINNTVVMGLKVLGIITYSTGTVSDVYFFQSLGNFFIRNDFHDIAYAFMEKVNFVELLFCFLLSFTVNLFFKFKYSRSLLFTTMIYLLGTIIYICTTQFSAYLIDL